MERAKHPREEEHGSPKPDVLKVLFPVIGKIIKFTNPTRNTTLEFSVGKGYSCEKFLSLAVISYALKFRAASSPSIFTWRRWKEAHKINNNP